MECASCGMHTKKAGEYHPLEACALFAYFKDGDRVRDGLRRIAEQYTTDIRKKPKTPRRSRDAR